MNGKEKSNITKNKKSKNKTKPKEVSIFTIMFVLILIALVIGLYFGIRYIVITLQYKQYTDKMYNYGYNELYDNQKATATQSVTNGELIKVIIGSIQNNKDIFNAYYLADKNYNETYNWNEYAKYLGLNDFMGNVNLNEEAKTIDAAMLVVKTIESFAGVSIEQAELNMSEDKLNEFSDQEQVLIAKAVNAGIIPNKNSSLSDKNIIKGKLNKFIIILAEKYATMHYNQTTIGENGSTKIVTDKKKMPENYKEYPYIVDNIDKEVYEMPYIISAKSSFKNPKETYKLMGYLNGQTSNVMTRYFEKILNVDYTTITTEGFLKSISNNVIYRIDEQDVEEYVEYVKKNKIKLEGSATPLLPIMYNTGVQYVVRTKITFKVISSDTEYNLLFGDENSTVKYNSKEMTMYVDVPMGMTLNSKSLLVNISCLAKNMPTQSTLVTLEDRG